MVLLNNLLQSRNIKHKLGFSEFGQPSAPWDAKRSKLQGRSDVIIYLLVTSRSFRDVVKYSTILQESNK